MAYKLETCKQPKLTRACYMQSNINDQDIEPRKKTKPVGYISIVAAKVLMVFLDIF